MWKVICFFALGTFLPVLSFSFGGITIQRKAVRQRIAWGESVRTDASAMNELPAAIDGGPANGMSAAELVTSLLGKIEGTNRGVDCTSEQHEEIDRRIEQLNTLGQDTDWLKDNRVFGNYNVAYVSLGSSQKAQGNPAGGRWRGRIGRSVFRTDEMFQHLVEPATVVNMVAFKAFGLLKGCVTLRGEFQAIPDKPNFVRASFGPPLINFFGKHGLTMRAGPNSSVRLAATYVDDRIRLGKGGRGSLFVFTRGGPADAPMADEWKFYAAEGARPIKARVLGAAAACGALVAGARSAFVPAGVLAFVSLALMVTQGGVINDPPEVESAAIM